MQHRDNILSQCTHWIFDMDGTLTCAIHDFDAIRDALGIDRGIPILEAIEKMPEPQAIQATQDLFDIEMEIAGRATRQPGAGELLQHLLDQGFTVGILTRNGFDIAIETLKAAHLVEFFPQAAVLGRESCRPKPDPAGVHLHMQRWQSQAADTVMVGDYRFDLEAGHRAGVHTVHLDVDNGEVWPDFTSVRVSTLAELQQLIV